MPRILIYWAVVGVIALGGFFFRHTLRSHDIID